jgi:Zn-finger nucleic acid-binding protein
MTELEQERRQNLKEYYKYVLSCNVCHKEYGADVKDIRYSQTCPVCRQVLIDRGSQLANTSKTSRIQSQKRESMRVQRQR